MTTKSLRVAAAVGVLSLLLGTAPARAQSLDEALRLFKDGELADAALMFYDVLLNDPNPDRRDQAEVYLAATLRKMDILVPALFYYQDIFKAGPENRYYLNAIQGLLEVQKGLRDPFFVPLIIDRNFDAEGFGRLSPDKIGRINYLIGELTLRRGENDDAKLFLEYVPPEHPLYAQARYLLGVLTIQRGDAKGALQHFQAVLQHVDVEADDDELQRVRNLSLLASARTEYGRGNFQRAIDFYEQVPRFSREWFYALYEAAWPYFRLDEYGKALGTLQSATSPFFAKRHVPEAYVIRGTTYFVNCQWDRVRRAVKRFKRVYDPMVEELDGYLGNGREAVDYYRDVVAGGDGQFSIEVAREVRRRTRFKKYHYVLQHMQWELEEIERVEAWRNSRLADDLRSIVADQREQLQPVVGSWVKSRLQFILDQLKHFQNQNNILDFEVTDAERKWLEQGKEILKGRRARLPRPEIPNDQWQHWNFEGEYWKDELGYIQHSLRTECF